MPADIARSLQETKHYVQVLTGFPNYPSGNTYPGYRLRPILQETIQSVPVTRVLLYPDHSTSKIKRALNYASFAISSMTGALINQRPDVVLAVYPPVTIGFPAWLLSRLWRVPLVLYVMDIWPDELRAAGAISGGVVEGFIARLAMWGYRKAARIIVITPGFRQNLIEKGVDADTIETVAQMVDTDRYRDLRPGPDTGDEHGLAGRFNVMYAGNLGRAQLLDTVLEAASLLKRVPSVRFVLVGDGIDAKRLKGRAKEMELHNVLFVGQQSPEAMDSIYAWADVLLLLLRDDPVFRMVVPHKLLGYMSSTKPIIGAVSGDAATVITSSDAGFVCPPGDPRALADAVMRMHNLPAPERRRMAENGRRAALTHYDRRQQGQLIADLLSRVLANWKNQSEPSRSRA